MARRLITWPTRAMILWLAGAYIAGPLAHCMECHTPVLSLVQRDWPRLGAGGMPFEGPRGIVVAPNITRTRRTAASATGPMIRCAVLLQRVLPLTAAIYCRRWVPAHRSIRISPQAICATLSPTSGRFPRSR
jgi:hypothetical protein